MPGATILDQLGIDYHRLTFRNQGREYRLTDLHGQIVTDPLALYGQDYPIMYPQGVGRCIDTRGVFS